MAVLKIPVVYFDLIEALLDSGTLTEAEALRRSNVETATSAVLAEWIEKWRDWSRGDAGSMR